MDQSENNSNDKKKQIILRISPKLWNELAAWAEDDFRSINGQIEYLLTECVRQRRGKKLEKNDPEDSGE
ncbi:Arc family DNA-binding protein [Gracilinema caldarium]|uniref:Arc family DNA-binding protein n=1 Tax=Gracilinema caldarium TaxID=215591 RepID=UPI0026E9F170|nr:Arc family DNA-binding protein [Gracilinema caldarium]